MEPNEETHHISLLFNRMKGDNDRLLKFVERLRKEPITYLMRGKDLIPQDVDLTDYRQADYYCSEIERNPKYALYQDAVIVLKACNDALKRKQVNEDHIRWINGSWSGINKAEETKAVISKDSGKRGKKGGEQPKEKEPIILAVIEYLRKNTKYIKMFYKDIAERFKHDVRSDTPISVKFDGHNYAVYADGKKIYYALTDKKSDQASKSIAYATFKNRYIAKAKERLNKE